MRYLCQGTCGLESIPLESQDQIAPSHVVIKCLARVQGWDGYLASHEVYFYVFDSLPIFLAFVTYAALHSSVWLPDAPAHSARTAVSPAGDVAHLNGARFGGATSLQPPGSERMLKGSQV